MVEKYQRGSEEYKELDVKINEIMNGMNGMRWDKCFDILANCIERLLESMDDDEARQHVLQCLNRFVLILMIGEPDYDQAMLDAEAFVEAMPAPDSPTKH